MATVAAVIFHGLPLAPLALASTDKSLCNRLERAGHIEARVNKANRFVNPPNPIEAPH